MLDQMTIEYVQTTLEELSEVERCILSIEENPSDNPDLLKLRRIIHSIKGSAGSYGFRTSSLICHKMEDLIANLHPGEKGSGLISDLLKLTDMLSNSFNPDQTEINEIRNALQGVDAKENSLGFRALSIGFSRSLYRGIQAILSEQGIASTQTGDTCEAVNLLLTEKFEFIFTSQELPLISGSCLINAFNAMFPNNGSKIYLITSHDNIVPPQKSVILPKNQTLFYTVEKEISVSLEALTNEFAHPQENHSVRKIVHIDDDPSIQNLVKYSLNKHSPTEVFQSADATDTIPLCEKHKPDLLLLDYHINGFNMEKLLVSLKENARTSSIPVIFMTGEENKDRLKNLKELGTTGIIKKPFRPISLKKNIIRLISGS